MGQKNLITLFKGVIDRDLKPSWVMNVNVRSHRDKISPKSSTFFFSNTNDF